MNARHKKFITEKLIPFILREQGNGFIMEDWRRKYTKADVKGAAEGNWTFDGVEHKVPACETVCCIGGSVNHLQRVPLDSQQDHRAAKALGLTYEQGQGLFYQWMPGSSSSYCWPEKYALRFKAANTPYKKAGGGGSPEGSCTDGRGMSGPYDADGKLIG